MQCNGVLRQCYLECGCSQLWGTSPSAFMVTSASASALWNVNSFTWSNIFNPNFTLLQHEKFRLLADAERLYPLWRPGGYNFFFHFLVFDISNPKVGASKWEEDDTMMLLPMLFSWHLIANLLIQVFVFFCISISTRELMLILSSWWTWFQGGWLLLTRMKSLGGKQDDDYSRWPRSEIRSLMVSFSGYSWRKCPTLTTSWFFQTCLPPKMGPSTISLVNQY